MRSKIYLNIKSPCKNTNANAVGNGKSKLSMVEKEHNHLGATDKNMGNINEKVTDTATGYHRNKSTNTVLD